MKPKPIQVSESIYNELIRRGTIPAHGTGDKIGVFYVEGTFEEDPPAFDNTDPLQRCELWQAQAQALHDKLLFGMALFEVIK